MRFLASNLAQPFPIKFSNKGLQLLVFMWNKCAKILNLGMLLSVFLLFSGCVNYAENQKMIEIQSEIFLVEIAKTPAEKIAGLMHRPKLERNTGMLFEYDQPQELSFWMKNTLIPLRIIWIDKADKIIGYTDATPCQEEPCPFYKSPGLVTKILEINPQDLNPELGETITVN